MTRISWRNFTGGEVSPLLCARYDLRKYGSALACCLNFLPNPHGDLERRPGTAFMAELDGESVLIPFRFNTDPAHNYALIFSNGRIRAAQPGRGLVSGMELASPYTAEQARQISYAQVGDVLYLAHEDHPLRKITRSGAGEPYTWALTEVALNRSLPVPEAPRVFPQRGLKSESGVEQYAKHENYTLSYRITAVDRQGTETCAGEAGCAVFRYPTDWVAGDAVELRWTAVDGAEEYNIYRDSAGYYGYIGTVKHTQVKTAEEGGTFTGNRLFSTLGVDFLPDLPCTWYIHRQGTFHVSSTPQAEGGAVYPSWLAEDASHRAVFNGTEWIVFHSSAMDEDLADLTRGRWTNLVTATGLNYPDGTGGNICFMPELEGGQVRESVWFMDENFEADAGQTPPEDWNPFADGNHPRAVAFHQQRLVLGGTRRQPSTIFMSRTGDYENFRRSRPMRDDDPLEMTLASGSIDEIQWLVSFGNLLTGTSGAEYIIRSSGSALTPSDCTASAASFWGSSSLKPIVIGTSVLHAARAGGHIRDLYYSWETEGYNGNDLSVLAPNLAEESEPVQWAFVRAPNPEIRIVRADGVCLVLSYVREQNISAWSRMKTQGAFKSVCELCGTGRSEILYAVCRKGADGEEIWTLEREADRFQERQDIAESWYLDCAVQMRAAEKRAYVSCPEIIGRMHREGDTVQVLADGSPAQAEFTGGMLVLPYPAETVLAGLPFLSVFATLPAEADGNDGTTLARMRAFGRCWLRLRRSVGGWIRVSEPGELYSTDADTWEQGQYWELPFLPAEWGQAVPPYSGDLEALPGGGMQTDAVLCVRQTLPLPFRVSALTAEIEFGA